MDRENVLFYLRVILLPLAIPATFLRATFSTWPILERSHQRQEERYQRLWDLLPSAIQDLVDADKAEEIPDKAVRRFARMLGDYNLVRERMDGARDLLMKSQFINALDANSRRLRNAESREQAAMQALSM